MKLITALIFLICTKYSFCQQNVQFKVIRIYRYSDGVLLSGININTNDTSNIISVRNEDKRLYKYEKIRVGKSYVFSIDTLQQSQAYLRDGFVVKIKTTIVWKPKDGIKNIPVVAKNTNGDYILKETLLSIQKVD